MFDPLGRDINYLRIAITDRCNLRCMYCMPPQGLALCSHNDILSFEEILAVVTIAVREFGIRKIRLTGGEPLLRRNVVELVRMLAAVPHIEDLAMTTNGTLLALYAQDLARAGLKRVNVSLDTLDAQRFAAITGMLHDNCGDAYKGDEVKVVDDCCNVRTVLRGIDAAIQARLTPVKINCVVAQSAKEADAVAVQQYAERRGLDVRFIKRMDFARGIFAKVIGGTAGECHTCSRLRLLTDGRILPCLFSDKTFAIRELGIREALLQAISHKPKCGMPCQHKWMGSIGG